MNRRLAAGFQIRGSCTWSKNLDMNSALTVAQANNQPQLVLDRNDPGRDWGPSALNVTHQSSIRGQYGLPFGNDNRWLNDATALRLKLARGWQVNGISTMLSGFPFTPTLGQNRSGDGDTRNPDRPDLNPSFTGSVAGHAGPVVQPECICATFGRDLREPGPWRIPRAIGAGCLRV